MGEKKLKIIMMMFQPSVVARGLEKKLIELGNDVQTVIGDFNIIHEVMDETDLFIFNLPNKIEDDNKELMELEKIGNTLISKDKRMILVGEKEIRNGLIKVYENVKEFVWVNRPVEMDKLISAIDRAFIAKTEWTAGNRILIVDDDPDYAKMVRGWIKDSYKVDILTSGKLAIPFLLKAPKEERVSLILLDYEMPEMDGPQVLQMLRKEPEIARIPVVFLTGVDSREGVSKVMALKPDGYILKSATREDLLKYLDSKLKCE